ncbi:MAG: hypothetical protein ACJA0H_001955, partial [Francisellaceae bacterium]
MLNIPVINKSDSNFNDFDFIIISSKDFETEIYEELILKLTANKIGRLYNLDHEKIFNEIYSRNHWKSSESHSGKGSEIQQVQTLVQQLPFIFKEFKIKKLLDLPCGDFNWMQRVLPADVKYIGADIVENLVTQNQQNYASKNIRFTHLNLISSKLPEADLLLCRDCLVHFSLKDIKLALNNIRQS